MTKPDHLLARVIALVGATLFPIPNARAQDHSPPTRQLVEELRLDATTEDFPSLRWFSVGPRGEIAVPIDQDQQVRLYDAHGIKLGAVGRVGSGPAEFRKVSWLGWMADTVWAYDDALMRLTFIAPTGKFLRSTPLEADLNKGGLARDGVAPQGIFKFVPMSVTVGGLLTGSAMMSVGGGTSGSKDVILSVTADGHNERIIAAKPPMDPAFVTFKPDEGSAVLLAVPFALSPRVAFAADGNRFAFLSTELTDRGGSYTLTLIGAKGDTLLSRRYPFEGTPIPRSTADSVVNAIGAPAKPGGPPRYPPALAAKLRDLVRAKLPKVYPPVSDLVLGLDNSIWIVMRPAAAGTEALALDSMGRPVERIVIPRKSRLVQATLDRAWMLETDTDDLASIVRYRLR